MRLGSPLKAVCVCVSRRNTAIPVPVVLAFNIHLQYELSSIKAYCLCVQNLRLTSNHIAKYIFPVAFPRTTTYNGCQKIKWSHFISAVTGILFSVCKLI